MMEVPLLYCHVAVRLKHYVLVFGGKSTVEEDARYKDIMRCIWSYNLYTEQWKMYIIQEPNSVPPVAKFGASAVAIGTDVYMFGSNVSNNVWRLTINEKRCFTWTKIPKKAKSKTPSPREGHSAWEYMGKMWVFGGGGLPPCYGFLNEHGDGTGIINNQLLCYDPFNNAWANPKCFGDVPCPREHHGTAIIMDKVYLYGGTYRTNLFECFFMMNMDSLSWTMVETNGPNPGPRFGLSLTGITDNQLVLFGGCNSVCISDETWIFDIKNGMWKQYTQFNDEDRYRHTCTRGLTNSVFIIGGLDTDTEPTSHFLLEPKSLQQLAVHMIYQYKNLLPWKFLPSRIMDQLMDVTKQYVC